MKNNNYFCRKYFTKNMLTYTILFLIGSIVSGFVTIDLPKADGTKQVLKSLSVATRELLSIDACQQIYFKYTPRFVGIVARSA